MVGNFSTAEDAEIIRLKEQSGLGWKALARAFNANAALTTERSQGCLQVRYSRYLSASKNTPGRRNALAVLQAGIQGPTVNHIAPAPSSAPASAPPTPPAPAPNPASAPQSQPATAIPVQPAKARRSTRLFNSAEVQPVAAPLPGQPAPAVASPRRSSRRQAVVRSGQARANPLRSNHSATTAPVISPIPVATSPAATVTVAIIVDANSDATADANANAAVADATAGATVDTVIDATAASPDKPSVVAPVTAPVTAPDPLAGWLAKLQSGEMELREGGERNEQKANFVEGITNPPPTQADMNKARRGITEREAERQYRQHVKATRGYSRAEYSAWIHERSLARYPEFPRDNDEFARQLGFTGWPKPEAR